MNNLDIFRKDFLNAKTWAQRKDGVPLDLLDNLSNQELKSAEIELIQALSLTDSWPILGLGHIKSQDSLGKLYELVGKGDSHIRIVIAHSIFQICQDEKMIDIVLKEAPRIQDQYQLIDVLYFFPGFKNEKITELIYKFRDHKEYLVAYNATTSLGLPTDEIIEKFKSKGNRKFWSKLFK